MILVTLINLLSSNKFSYISLSPISVTCHTGVPARSCDNLQIFTFYFNTLIEPFPF